MPELHKLTPALGSLQDRGFKVALVTDGRMSGASGKVPAAIHVSPEAAHGGPLARVQTGDMITLDAERGTLELVEDGFETRELAQLDTSVTLGMGRELFDRFPRRCQCGRRGRDLHSRIGREHDPRPVTV